MYSSHTVSASSLLANDQTLGSTTPLKISAIKDVVGGTASLVNGNVVFTPDLNYRGMMSFKYTTTDSASSGHTALQVTDSNTGQTATMYARATLATSDLPTDPLVAQQWYLNDTNIIPVWDNYTGAGVKIGQIEANGTYALNDETLNYNHPDLSANVNLDWYTRESITGHLAYQLF
jgi:hypothetical protein